MKRILFYILMLLSSVVVFHSCRKDLSSLDTQEIKGITIDTAGHSMLSVFQFEKLLLKPKLIMDGVNEQNLEYEWKISAGPHIPGYQTIGNSRDLEYEVSQIPTIANKFYQILYTITDKSNGLQYVMAWPLVVRNSIGEGLVIATSADGVNSDISHIMSPLVTTDFSGESVKHHIFSGVNGTTIPGILTQLRFSKLKGVGEIMMATSDKSLMAIKTMDYSLAAQNEELFFTPPASIRPQLTGALTQHDILVSNGKMYGVWLEISAKFGVPFDSRYTVPSHVALDGNSNYPNAVISFYDETEERFIYQQSVQSWGDRKMHPTPNVAGAPFDPGNLPGKINLAAGVSNANEFLHVLKDKNTQSVHLYIIEDAKYDDDFNLIAPAPKAVYDFSSAPEIQQAEYFVLLDDQKILYYATKNKIYAALYSSSVPTFSERYTVPAGEEITTLQVYRQADYPKRADWDPPYISTNNRQLIMSTYNGTEGKVHILPMINIGLGNIDIPKIKVYGGFDRISAIGTQR